MAQHNAKKNLIELPRGAAETGGKSTYVNDSLDSVETIEEVFDLPYDFTTLCNQAGMTPRKWLHNYDTSH